MIAFGVQPKRTRKVLVQGCRWKKGSIRWMKSLAREEEEALLKAGGLKEMAKGSEILREMARR